jgi:endonuclease YncB( thermonuclease family)
MTKHAPSISTYACAVESVVDGDTLHCALTGELLSGLLPTKTEITVHPKLRLSGVNCPEMSTPAGLTARSYTVQWLLDHAAPYTVSVRGSGLDKYRNRVDGRLIAADGACLNDDLLTSGNAARA